MNLSQVKHSLLRLFSISCLLAFDYTAIASAQTQQPRKELERLSYFIGQWECQQPAAAKDPTGKFIWTVKLDLNNFWYAGNARQIEIPDTETIAIDSKEFLGYDLVSQKLFRFVIVGNGSSLSLTTSDWQDRKLVWQGSIVDRGQIRPLRQEITRKSKNKFVATYFINDNQGAWQPVVDEVCKRAK